jgi:hypothetical protein
MSLENDFKEVFSYSMHAGGGTNLNFDDIDKNLYNTRKVDRYFLEGIKIDPTVHSSQTFFANSFYFLVAGEIDIKYQDGSDDRVSGSYYNSNYWVSYKKFWTENKPCKIIPSQNACLYKIQRIKEIQNDSPLNDLSNLNVIVKKVSADNVSFTTTGNSILLVFNASMEEFTLRNETIVFNTSTESDYCEILIDKNPQFIKFKNYYRFSVNGNCTFSTANSCHLVLLTPK